MKKFTAFLLWSSAVIFAAIGVYFLAVPEDAASAIGVSMLNDTGRTDIRATYGGMVLGIAVFFAWAALAPERTKAGLVSLAFVYGGLALGRIVAIATGDRPGSMMWLFLAIELGYTLASVICIRSGTRG
jgi:hypothetical protein